MKVTLAGNATSYGTNGADWHLKYYGKLPDYYLSKEDAKSLGWRHKKGNLETIAPGKMIFGGIYNNDDGKLPTAKNRIWYEADIGLVNTISRAKQPGTRLLYSNDGLLYITIDHYKTVHKIGTWK